MNVKMLLSFSLLLIAKATSAETDCELFPLKICERPKELDAIPIEVLEFNDYCVATKSNLRCLKGWQDECGTDRIEFFQSSEIYDAVYSTLSDICEEGTLLNTVVTQNLKCINETFGKTRCNNESMEFVDPFVKEVHENEGFQQKFSIFCLRSTFAIDCALRALSENCGKLLSEAALEVVRRSKTLENSCSVSRAQSVLDEMDNLGLTEDKKQSLTHLLEKMIEANSD